MRYWLGKNQLKNGNWLAAWDSNSQDADIKVYENDLEMVEVSVLEFYYLRFLYRVRKLLHV